MSTDKGVKFDSNKPRMDIVLGGFAKALYEVGNVGTFGANKYSDNGWKYVDNGVERYLSAMLRHYINFKNGEFIDDDSNMSHLAHMAWNALAVLQMYIDDGGEVKGEDVVDFTPGGFIKT